MFTVAIENLAASRAENGGEMSRLMMVNELLVQNQTNLEAAHGRIMDADIALESPRFARQNGTNDVEAGLSGHSVLGGSPEVEAPQ